MKKFIAILLCAILTFLCAVPVFATDEQTADGSQAVSLSAGKAALCNQFQYGKAALEYAYYSPVKGSNDNTKYPLVIWVHGNSSGEYNGNQIDAYNFSNWSSREYQNRFEGTNGAYLLAARDTNSTVAWLPAMAIPLKSTIDTFISEHSDSIDTSRIYIGGYCVGGGMVFSMVSAYKDFFAAAFPCVPYTMPTTATLNGCADTPMWFVSSIHDIYVDYDSLALPRWNCLMSVSSCPSSCRLTSVESTCEVEGVKKVNDPHNVWVEVCNDMFTIYNEPFDFCTTVDGNGNEISLSYPDGMISWMSSFSLDKDVSENNPSFFEKIINFFKMIFEFFKNLF